MKKVILRIICLLAILSLLGCNNKEYCIDRSTVKDICGIEQPSGAYKSIVLNKEDINTFIDNIEKLHLKKTLKKSETEGRDFFFTINYLDGKHENINLSQREIDINGYIYKTSSYNYENFKCFFE